MVLSAVKQGTNSTYFSEEEIVMYSVDEVLEGLINTNTATSVALNVLKALKLVGEDKPSYLQILRLINQLHIQEGRESYRARKVRELMMDLVTNALEEESTVLTVDSNGDCWLRYQNSHFRLYLAPEDGIKLLIHGGDYYLY
jgi:hypothetical protein